jgi:hypothetical protein
MATCNRRDSANFPEIPEGAENVYTTGARLTHNLKNSVQPPACCAVVGETGTLRQRSPADAWLTRRFAVGPGVAGDYLPAATGGVRQ